VGRYFGREPRYSRQEIELQAQQAIEARVGMGRPPAGDWLPIEERLARMDRELAARAPAEGVPEPPPTRQGEAHPSLSVAEIRLPATATAKARRPAQVPDGAGHPGRGSRRSVATKER
jgi:hypothetical protein